MLQRSLAGFVGLAALVVVLAVPSLASAANSCDVGTVDKTWTGNTNASWFTPTNWSGNAVPTAGQDVCVPNAAPNAPVVDQAGPALAASVESFKPIQVTAGTLKLSSATQASLFHGDLDLAASTTLDNKFSATVQGDLDWSSATITNSAGGAAGTVTVAAAGTTTATVADSQRTLNHQVLHIDGTGTFAGNDPDVFNDDTYLQNGATLEIGSGGSLDLQGDQDIINNGGTGTNSVHVLSGGTLSRSSGSNPAIITTQLDNDGTVSATDASTLASPALSLQGGSGTQTSSGQFSAASGAVIDFNGGTHKVGTGASFGGAGKVGIVAGEVDTSGAVTSGASTTLSLSNSTLANTGTLTVNGTLDWGNASTIAGAGTTTVASGGTLTASGDCTNRFLDTATLRINGTGTLSGASAGCYFQTGLSNGAKLEIGSGGSLDLRDDQNIFDNGGATSLLHVLSGGTLTRTSAAGSGNAVVGVPVENDGTVSAAAGTVIDLSAGSSASSGSWAPASGALIRFTGGTHSVGGSSIGGAGVVTGSVTIAAATVFTVNGTYDWGTGTTISGAGTMTIAPGGTLTASGDCTTRNLDTATLRINGTAVLSGASAGCYFQTGLSNGAELEIGSGGNLDLRNDQNIFDNGGAGNLVHVLSGGTLTRTSAAGSDAAGVGVTFDNDGVTNSSAGVLRLSNGSGTQTSTGQFTAAGGATVQFSGGTHLLGSGSSFGGAGTISVSGGTVSGSGTISSAAATTLALAGSTLANTGTLTVNGTLDWGNASTIAGAGTTTVASGGTLTASGDCTNRFLDTATLRINGTGTLSGASAGCYFQTGLSNGAKLEIGSGGSLDLRDDQNIFDNGGATSLLHVLSGGTLTRTSAAGSDAAGVGVTFDNDGVTNSSAGVLRLSNGSGTQTSTGQFTAAGGATVQFSGGTHLLGSGSSFGGAGTISVSGGTVSGSGTISSAAATTLALAGGTLANTGTLTVNGTLDWGNASTIAGAGTTTVASGGTLTASGDCTNRFLDTATLRINGTGTLSGASAGCYFQTGLSNGAKLEIGSGGSLDLRDDQNIFDNGGATSLLHVLSGGTLTRTSAAGSGNAVVGVPVENDGTVSAAAGTVIDLSAGSSASSGSWAPASGALIRFTGGTHSVGGSSIGGAGVVTGSVTIAAATVFTVNGTYDWGTGTTISGAGTMTIAPGGTLTASGDCTTRNLDTATLRINGTAVLSGASAGCYFQTGLSNGAELEIGSGGNLDLRNDQNIFDNGGAGNLVHVLSGGTLTRTSAAGSGNADIGVPLTNDGTINVQAGIMRSSGTFTNYNQATDVLTGGTYAVRNGSVFQFTGADLKINAAEIILDGAGSTLQDTSAGDGLVHFATNNASGKLRLRNARNFTHAGAFTNNGLIDLAPTTKFTLSGGAGNFTQTATGTFATDIAGTVAGTSYGQLVAGNNATVAGTLDVDVSAYPPQTGDFFDVVSAANTRSGTFATVIGNGFAVSYLADRVRISPPTLTITDRRVDEPDTGTTNAQFEVNLSSPSAGTVTVNYATADGSAKAPGDYTATSGTLTFTPGQTQKFVNVPVRGDLRDEIATETYFVNLSTPALAEISDAQGVGRITDNDPPPSITIGDATKNEGGTEILSVDLSAPSNLPVTVNYATAPDTATSPADYPTKTGTVTINPGKTHKTVRIPTTQDVLDEADETFNVNLSGPTNATIADGTGQATILDNDAAPTLSIDDVSRNEGGTFVFTVTLSAASGQQVRVHYDTVDASAIAPGDYTAGSNNVTFTPGQLTRTISVASVNDIDDEPNETFGVHLSAPIKATIADADGTGTIVDND